MALFSSAASLGMSSRRTASLQLVDPVVEPLGLLVGERRHLGVVGERIEPLALRLQRREIGDRLVDRLKLGALAAELDQRLAIDRLRQALIDGLDAGNDGGDLFSR